MTLVSIGVPVHNGAAYLDAALSALRNQDHADLEIVVCENASQDDSRFIAERHAAADSRVRVEVSDDLLGAVENFNRCVALTKGDFFMWAAHDDAFDPSYVSRCLTELEGTGFGACTTDAFIVDQHGRIVSERIVDRRLMSARLRPRLRAHARAQDWLEVYALYRRAALPVEGPLVLCPGPDVLLTWKVLQEGPIAVVPQPLLSYRRTGEGYKTALESFSTMLAGSHGRDLSGLNARLWWALWLSVRARASANVARQELLLALLTRSWLRRLRDDLRAERALRQARS